MKGGKYNRTLRLLDVIYILNHNPQGISPAKIAEDCSISTRQAYRDLSDLEHYLKVPLWTDKGKWGIEPGRYLPPISFSLPEAMTIFLASRLLLAYSNVYNPSIERTFMKLNSVVTGPLRDEIRKTMEQMQKRETDQQFINTMELLARAWTEGRKAKVWYWTLGKKQPTERIIEPYFIQPAGLGHGNYVIGYCHRAKEIRTFKIERIQRIELLDEKYTVPADFDANEFLGSSWGIVVEGEVKTIKLKIDAPEIIRIMEETRWHPSQVTQRQPDGSAIVTLKLTVTTELVGFILSWGEKVEVLEPKKLREKVMETAKEMVKIYQKKKF